MFYVYDNGQHGLIAATADQSTGIFWYNGTYRVTGATGNGIGAGAKNTSIIVASQISDNQAGNFAALICENYSVTVGGVTYGDWYLPSIYELNLLYLQQGVVGGFGSNAYWSSTESSYNTAWCESLSNGTQYSGNYKATYGYQGSPGNVRAIRAF